MQKKQIGKPLSLTLFLMIGTVTTVEYEAWSDTAEFNSNPDHWNLHETLPESHPRNCANTEANEYSNCPLDGNWSPWKSWSACQGKCGKAGKRVRYRSCDSPVPTNGGAPCIGTTYTEEPCPIVECTFQQYFSEGESGQLTNKEVRLLRYLQAKHMQYIGLAAVFASFDGDISAVASVIARSDQPDVSYEADMYWSAVVCLRYSTGCPEEGQWSEWSEWGSCNAFCGGGLSIRTRECVGTMHPELDCIGSPFEITACNTHPCPPYAVHAFDWSTWSPWYGCQSSKCNSRHFKYREHCCQERNIAVERRDSVPSQLSGPIIRAEAEGKKPFIEFEFRQVQPERESDTFSLDNPYAQADKVRNQNSNYLRFQPNNLGVASLFSPRRVRRFIADADGSGITNICKPTPSHFVCTGPSFEVEECETESLNGCNGNPFWSSWSEWSCSVICGIGQSRRWRACLARNMANPTQWTSCPGPYVEDSTCFPRPCNEQTEKQVEFDGESSTVWYTPTNRSAQMFRVYVKLKPKQPEGTILWRASPNQCESESSVTKCVKELSLTLRGGHVHFTATYRACSLELLMDQPIQLHKWDEVSVSIENWIGTLRIGSSPVMLHGNFTCTGGSEELQISSPNWDMRTTVGSRDGKSHFFFGTISHLAINYESWPLSPALPAGTSDRAFSYISYSQNIQIADGFWDENVKVIAEDESVLIYPDKGSLRVDFSLAFKSQDPEGLVLTIEGDDGVIPLFYKVFLESSHFHLLFQCFHETFSLIQSREYPECFVEEVNPYPIESGSWYLISVTAQTTGINLTINTESSVQLRHNKKFNFQYISIGWSKSSEKDISSDEVGTAKSAWEQPMQLSIANFELSDNDETYRSIRMEEMPIFENSFASIFTSSVAEKYTELYHVADDPLTLSCELPPLVSNDEQAKVLWTKSDQVISSELGEHEVDKTTVERRNEDDEQVLISVLTLTPRKASDSGFYSCIFLEQGKSRTLQAFGITIVDQGDQKNSEVAAMEVADSSSFYITIAVVVVGVVFLLLVVCGSAIFFCRSRMKKKQDSSLSLMVNVEDNSSEEPDFELKPGRRFSRQLAHPKEAILSTTINIEPSMDADAGISSKTVEINETSYQHTVDIISDSEKIKDIPPIPRRVSFLQRSSPPESKSTLVQNNAKLPEKAIAPPPDSSKASASKNNRHETKEGTIANV